jgi:protein-disulfide isomerase
VHRRSFLASSLAALGGPALLVNRISVSAAASEQTGSFKVLTRDQLAAVLSDEPERLIRGPRKGRLSIVEFGDFTCPYTDGSRAVVNETLNNNKSFVYCFRHLPLNQHPPVASYCAYYFEAVSALYPEKGWAFFEALFDARPQIIAAELGFSKVNSHEIIKSIAESLDIDPLIISDELSDSTVGRVVQSDILRARTLGFNTTPTFIVNGSVIIGKPSASDLGQALRRRI